MDAVSPFPDPRLRGIYEQHHRARWFLSLALEAEDPDARFRFLIAAVYFARAIVELMLDAARAQELKDYCDKNEQKCRKEFEEQLAPRLPHYYLIEKIRLHDFHRFGCIPPSPTREEIFFGGPMKLTAGKGAALLTIPPSGPKVTLTGKSSKKDQRSLCNADGCFFDDVSGQYLPLQRILAEYLKVVPATINWLKQLKAG